MKHNHIFAAAIATALMMTAAVSSATAAGVDHSAYGFQIGKAGRTTQAAPYAGMNYEGGEQGDISAYSFQAGRAGKPWNSAK